MLHNYTQFFAYHGKDKKLSQSSCYLKNNGWELTLCPKNFRVVEFHALKNVAKLFMENRIHIFIYFPLNNLMPNFEYDDKFLHRKYITGTYQFDI